MYARLAALAERRAPLVVAAWVLAAVSLALAAPSLREVGIQDEASFLPGSSPSQRAARLLRRLFPDDPSLDAGVVVLSRAGGLTAADRAYVGRLTAWLRHGEVAGAVGSVQSAATDPALGALLRSPDGAAELVVVGFRSSPFSPRTNDAVGRIRRHLDATAPAGLEHHLTGTAGLAADQARGLVDSFDRTTVAAALLVLVILVLVYRSALAPLVPLATIGVAFLVARGVVGLLAEHGFRVASLAETFMVVMVFGAGTDYCMFAISRYREDLAHGGAPRVTLRRSTTVVGPVIAASALTVIAGFVSQLSARFGMFKTMGPAMGVAIFVTLVAGLTLTPALLSLAGRRAFWPGPLADPRAGHASRRWQCVAAAVRGRPAGVLLAGVALLLLPAAGLGSFKGSFDLVRELPPSADAREGFDALRRHFPPGMLAPVYLVLWADGPITDDARLAAVDHLTDVLRDRPGVAEVRSLTQPAGAPLTPADLQRFGQGGLAGAGLDPHTVDIGPLLTAASQPGGLRFTGPVLRRYPQLVHGPLRFFFGADGNSTRIVVALAGNPYDRSALPVIRSLDDVADRALSGSALSGSRLAVGGPASVFVDLQDIGNTDFRVMAAVLVAVLFALLGLVLRSAVAPFYLLASVVLSYVATLGLCALVFIEVLGEPGISFWLPPFLFVVLVGLGADYNIFVMSRIREEVDAGAGVRDAVTRSLVATGHVVASAGAVLAGTFAVLLLAPMPQLRQIGFAVTVGVAINTFLVPSVIVPAVTVLLGRWALWPETRRPRDLRTRDPRHVALAGAGIAVLAAGLAALVATARPEPAVTVVGSQPRGYQQPPSELPASPSGS